MPKKGKYYHLEQAMDALTNDQLGHDKYKHYQDTMKRIKGNFDKSILYDCINECLVIKLKIGELSEDIKNWKVTTTDIATKLNKLESISDNIKEINTSKIELGIEIHNVKRKINTIKNKLTSDVKELEKKLKEKENGLKEEKAQERELQEQQGVSSSSDQSPVKETGAVPKKKSEYKEKRREQYLLGQQEEKEQRQKKHEESRVQNIQQKNRRMQTRSGCFNFSTPYSEIVNAAHDEIIEKMSNFIHISHLKYENVDKTVLKVSDLILNYYAKVYTFSRIVKNITDKTESSKKKIEDKNKQSLYKNYNYLIKILISIYKNQAEKEVKKKIDKTESNFNAVANIIASVTNAPTPLNISSDNINKIKEYFRENALKETKNQNNEEIIDHMNIFYNSCTIEEVLQKLKQEDKITEIEKHWSLFCKFNDIISSIEESIYNDFIKLGNRKVNNILPKKVTEKHGGKDNVVTIISMSDKEEKMFDSTLECYIKIYCASTAVQNMVKRVVKEDLTQTLINTGLTDVQNKFPQLPKDQTTPFMDLYSIFTQKTEKKVQNIEKSFNTVIGILSKDVLNLTAFSYSDIPAVDNISKIKDDLKKAVINNANKLVPYKQKIEKGGKVCKVYRTEQHKEISKGFIESLDNFLKNNGYQEKVDKILEELIKQYQHSPSHEVEEASLQGGACAQTER